MDLSSPVTGLFPYAVFGDRIVIKRSRRGLHA